MHQMIRRVVVHSLHDVRIEEVLRPTPSPDQVLVQPSWVGICGSDTHACLGQHPFITLPYHPGHEVVGVVKEVGDQVTGFQPGDRVVVEPNLPCGACPQCHAGRYNICRHLAVFGCQTPGGLADLFAISSNRLHPVPDGLTDYDAVLAEPLATPVHAVRAAGDLSGCRVAVLGAGPIGLLIMVAARAAGAAKIMATDVRASKRQRARSLGADAALDANQDVTARAQEALGDRPDVVFDCVARESSMAQATDMVSKGGQVILVGVGQPGTTPVRLDLVQDREISIRGSLMFVAEDFVTSLKMLSEGAVSTDQLVTATYTGLRRAGDAFRASTDPEQCKVLIRLGTNDATS